jgi:hypothetical protein
MASLDYLQALPSSPDLVDCSSHFETASQLHNKSPFVTHPHGSIPHTWTWPTTAYSPQPTHFTMDYSMSPTTASFPRYNHDNKTQTTLPVHHVINQINNQLPTPRPSIESNAQFPILTQPQQYQPLATPIQQGYWVYPPLPITQPHTQPMIIYQPTPTYLHQTFQPLLSSFQPTPTPPQTQSGPERLKTPRFPTPIPLPPLPLDLRTQPLSLTSSYGPEQLSISQRLDLIDSPTVITRVEHQPLPPPPQVLGWVPPNERPIPPRTIELDNGNITYPTGYLQGVYETNNEACGSGNLMVDVEADMRSDRIHTAGFFPVTSVPYFEQPPVKITRVRPDNTVVTLTRRTVPPTKTSRQHPYRTSAIPASTIEPALSNLALPNQINTLPLYTPTNISYSQESEPPTTPIYAIPPSFISPQVTNEVSTPNERRTRKPRSRSKNKSTSDTVSHSKLYTIWDNRLMRSSLFDTSAGYVRVLLVGIMI